MTLILLDARDMFIFPCHFNSVNNNKNSIFKRKEHTCVCVCVRVQVPPSIANSQITVFPICRVKAYTNNFLLTCILCSSFYIQSYSVTLFIPIVKFINRKRIFNHSSYFSTIERHLIMLW